MEITYSSSTIRHFDAVIISVFQLPVFDTLEAAMHSCLATKDDSSTHEMIPDLRGRPGIMLTSAASYYIDTWAWGAPTRMNLENLKTGAIRLLYSIYLSFKSTGN